MAQLRRAWPLSSTYSFHTRQPSIPGTQKKPWYVFLRKGKYKYIRTLIEGEIEELYDFDKDPGELVNLALKKEYAGILQRYRAATIAELRRTNAGIVNNLPSLKKKK